MPSSPRQPSEFRRVAGRRFEEIATGKIISRRQYEKVIGRTESFERKALANLKSNPRLAASRTGRGRKRGAKATKARTPAALKKAREITRKEIKRVAASQESFRSLRIATSWDTTSIEMVRRTAEKLNLFRGYIVIAVLSTGRYLWDPQGFSAIDEPWRASDTKRIEKAVNANSLRYQLEKEEIISALIHFQNKAHGNQ